MVEKSRVHLIVEGRVQGVGFRYFTADSATELGVTGWVRNRWDDSVEIVAEGDRETLEKFLQRVRRGPRTAFVSNLQIDWEKATGQYEGFFVFPSI